MMTKKGRTIRMRKPETPEELLAMLKFQLVSLPDDQAIEDAIEKMLSSKELIDKNAKDIFRSLLYDLVREGLTEYSEASRRKH
jgi:hypothetical protein